MSRPVYMPQSNQSLMVNWQPPRSFWARLVAVFKRVVL